MDPISLCASILAIITTAETGIQRVQKAKQLWKAPLAIDGLVLEIQDLQSTLRDVAQFVKTANSVLYSERLSQPVDRASSMIDSIDTLFSSPVFSLTHLSNKNHSRLVWLRHNNEIKNLFEKLKLVRLDILLKLGVVAVYGSFVLNLCLVLLLIPLSSPLPLRSPLFSLTSHQVFFRAGAGINETIHWYPEYNLAAIVNHR